VAFVDSLEFGHVLGCTPSGAGSGGDTGAPSASDS
jgi:hypothetical protein